MGTPLTLVFQTANGAWRTDGTAGGTFALPAGGGSIFYEDGSAYVAVAGSGGAVELFRTDGSIAGTFEIGQLYQGASVNSPAPAGQIGDEVVYIGSDATHAAGVFVSVDGGPGQFITSLPVNDGSFTASLLGVANGKALFDVQNEVWVTDGTAGGTFLLGDGAGSPIQFPTQPMMMGGDVYFLENGQSLWQFSGARVTRISSAAIVGSATPSDVVTNGHDLFLLQASGSGPPSFVSWDGRSSSATTLLTLPDNSVSFGSDFVSGGEAYFSTKPTAGSTGPTHFYGTDGTAAGTILLGVGQYQAAIEVGGNYVLLGNDGTHGDGIYLSDGSPATLLESGTLDRLPFCLAGDKAYFSFDEALWVTDGTAAGTQMLANVGPVDLTALGDRIVFAATTSDQLWISDGTVAGTHPLPNSGSAPDDILGSFGMVGPPSEGVRDDFNGDGASDLLIGNASGAVVVGEVANGQISYAAVAGLGSEWSFKGDGDILGDGREGFLVENTAGAVVAGEVSGGSTSYTQVAALGPEWVFKGVGDFLGAGNDQFLIENTAGSVVVGEVESGAAAYTAVAALGPEWSFKAVGDFMGDGKSDFLIENSAGAVVVGEVMDGAAAYTQVAALGPEWKFVGAGDFLGAGEDDFLIENTAGEVVIGAVIGGAATYTAAAQLGSEWKFVGTGDYLDEGHDQFLIENASGAVVVADWTGGQVHFTQVAALGQEWTFH